MGGGQTDTHTQRHINTMTRPGLGAGQSENNQTNLLEKSDNLTCFVVVNTV